MAAVFIDPRAERSTTRSCICLWFWFQVRLACFLIERGRPRRPRNSGLKRVRRARGRTGQALASRPRATPGGLSASPDFRALALRLRSPRSPRVASGRSLSPRGVEVRLAYPGSAEGTPQKVSLAFATERNSLRTPLSLSLSLSLSPTLPLSHHGCLSRVLLSLSPTLSPRVARPGAAHRASERVTN